MSHSPMDGLSTQESSGDDYTSLASEIVDIFYKIYGTHPGFRVNHAKGIVALGSFVATPAAAELSCAALFDGSSIPFTARFSNDGGFPAIPDGAPGNIKGMAVKFHMPGGTEVDIVMLAIKTFPMATGDGFRDLLRAISESPDGAPKPTRLDEFAASHQTVSASFDTAATPDSFAHEEYRGLNAFIFVDKAGRRQAVRYVMNPEELVYLTADEADRKPLDFLIDDLPRRIAKKPVVFHLMAQLAEAGDQTKDPSQPWPNERHVVDLGVLTLHTTLANSREVQKDLLFLPTNLTDGIEFSDDKMPLLRTAVYGLAFARRSR
ncbi:catalase family peroxidase [Paraburkholderia sp. CNPSo 3274]|uniref:catalase family peroxidase n=1 Tax=Paraburkholderia sp. CNPSo 3274 TaxID=2940932 RepID=UPI0020B7D294|nr:catalase family peroxidase [Paraburkholderia sp. CNPSo 3274]MCP3713572.1 catalase family peroxidase [Paraburkholderia sp. CNPSo 3274]